MRRKPWQIWLVFCICLTVVTAVMVWLSVGMVRLEALRENDRIETEVARREAVLQERISAALYRMDLLLIPLVSEESARPHQHYRTVYFPVGAGADGKSNQALKQKSTSKQSIQANDQSAISTSVAEVSPLYEVSPELVKLHFEVLPDEEFVSPQVPSSLSGLSPALAAHLGQLDADVIRQREQSLLAVKSISNYEKLSAICQPVKNSVVSLEVFDNGFAYQSNGYQVPQIARAVERYNSVQQFSFEKLISKGSKGGRGSIGGKGSKGGRGRNKLEAQQEANASRAASDLNNRSNLNANIANSQALAYGNFANNDFAVTKSTKAIDVIYGVMQPVWIQGELLLVRPLKESGVTRYQCCWLNWERIQDALRAEGNDLLPMEEVQFEPVEDEDSVSLGMALTTLPVQLSMDREKLRAGFSLESDPALSGSLSAGTILSLAWIGFLLSAGVAAVLLQQVMGLSERRANFVSAVTHELRTPLTTFRMYSEMLAGGMVPPDKQEQYVGTLQRQANRLSHLVENVLQFAKLENSPDQSSVQAVQVGAMLDRFVDRLESRVGEEGFEFALRVPDEVGQLEVRTQPVMVEQVLFNLVDNACKYGKPSTTGKVELRLRCDAGWLRMEVSDGGPGVDVDERRRVFKPFHKTDLEAANSEPGVGLGLALCKRMAVSLGGKLTYRENEAGGATFELSLPG